MFVQVNHAVEEKVKKEVYRIAALKSVYLALHLKQHLEMSSSEKRKKIAEKKRLGQPAGKPRRVKSVKRRK